MNLNQILSKLISFETISETSNDEIASFIINFLNSYGIKSEKIKGDPGRFNIHSIIGPKVDGGIILSGHTDVVPTEGQLWSSNPFRLQKKGNRLYGRGSTDMKGFIAVVLSIIKGIKKTNSFNFFI